jgi:Tol biopolymer transport system component
VRDLPGGRTRLASRGLPEAPAGATTSVYEPALSRDGRLVAFTVATVPARGGLGATSSHVYVRDLRAGVTTAVGGGGAGFASNPALSGDGRWVAFTATARGTGRPLLHLHDVRSGRTRAITALRDGAIVDPQLSTDGSVVAYTAIRAGVSRVLVRRLDGRGPAEVASRASGRDGAPADGAAGDPALSADGRLVAFASDAANLAAAKRDRTRGVFVRDLAAATTTLVSRASGAAG